MEKRHIEVWGGHRDGKGCGACEAASENFHSSADYLLFARNF